MKRGKLFIILGQAGVGKRKILEAITEKHPEFFKVVTCTTRPPRKGEKEGWHHYFISKEKFDEMVTNNEFFEYVTTHNINYGTPIKDMKKALESGKNAILEVDIKGLLKIKNKIPNEVTIFLKYQDGDLEELVRNRLLNDTTRPHNEEDIQTRIETAKFEAKYVNDCDYSVVNPEGHPEKAIEEVERIIKDELQSTKEEIR